MVDKLKLLENLVEIVHYESQELGLTSKEDYSRAGSYAEKALSLLRRVYEEVKDHFPNEPIIRHIREMYEDAWDILIPSTYEESVLLDP